MQFSLLPLDVGFDLKATQHKVKLPYHDELTVTYHTKSRKTKTLTSTRRLVAKRLKRAGYNVSIEDTE